MTRRTRILLAACGAMVAMGAARAVAQPQPAGDAHVATAQPPTQQEGWHPAQGIHTLNPGDWPAHYPFADETEAAVAAPEVHHVRYLDSKVRLVEVGYFPGVVGNVHGHPFPSVFAVDAPVPHSTNTMVDATRNMIASVGAAPEGMAYPICRSATPQFPHHESNLDTYPHHFFRLEFLRVDGQGPMEEWRAWYRYTRVGPDGSRVLYEDDHARLVEVLVRPGETRRLAANPYPSVIAQDGYGAMAPLAKGAHTSAPLAAFETLRCSTTGPVLAKAITATTRPIHYYRIDFKRVDGDGLKDHWREWYPWLDAVKRAYDQSPNPRNF
jgi:hypothetical protein